MKNERAYYAVRELLTHYDAELTAFSIINQYIRLHSSFLHFSISSGISSKPVLSLIARSRRFITPPSTSASMKKSYQAYPISHAGYKARYQGHIKAEHQLYASRRFRTLQVHRTLLYRGRVRLYFTRQGKRCPAGTERQRLSPVCSHNRKPCLRYTVISAFCFQGIQKISIIQLSYPQS